MVLGRQGWCALWSAGPMSLGEPLTHCTPLLRTEDIYHDTASQEARAHPEYFSFPWDTANPRRDCFH